MFKFFLLLTLFYSPFSFALTIKEYIQEGQGNIKGKIIITNLKKLTGALSVEIGIKDHTINFTLKQDGKNETVVNLDSLKINSDTFIAVKAFINDKSTSKLFSVKAQPEQFAAEVKTEKPAKEIEKSSIQESETNNDSFEVDEAGRLTITITKGTIIGSLREIINGLEKSTGYTLNERIGDKKLLDQSITSNKSIDRYEQLYSLADEKIGELIFDDTEKTVTVIAAESLPVTEKITPIANSKAEATITLEQAIAPVLEENNQRLIYTRWNTLHLLQVANKSIKKLVDVYQATNNQVKQIIITPDKQVRLL